MTAPVMMPLFDEEDEFELAMLGDQMLEGVYLGETLIWTPFEPYSEVNANVTDKPVPLGAAGCWVQLVGGGGGAGQGYIGGTSGSRHGGCGGASAAVIPRFFIPVEYLGPTYSITTGLRGIGGYIEGSTEQVGATGGTGGNTIFASGDVLLIATGGPGGRGGSLSFRTGPAGAVAVVAGLSGVVTINGVKGGDGGSGSTSNGRPGANALPGGAAAGGGGGGISGGDDDDSSGGAGGNTATQQGGYGASANVSGDVAGNGPNSPAPGVPGAGGGGGRGRYGSGSASGGYTNGYGAGGGGGGAKRAGGNFGNSGGWGYSKVEWVSEAP